MPSKRKSSRKRNSLPVSRSLPPLDPQQRYDMLETSAYLRKSRSTVYEDIKAGKLRVIKDGGRVYVPGSEIVRLSSVDYATLG